MAASPEISSKTHRQANATFSSFREWLSDVHRVRTWILVYGRRSRGRAEFGQEKRGMRGRCFRVRAKCSTAQPQTAPARSTIAGRAHAVSELTSLSLAEARDGLKKKSFSAGELAAAHLTAIEKARVLNAFVLETPERALGMAKESDARLAGGKAGPLEGIPLAIKDMFFTARVRSTACSHILDNFVPTYQSTVTSQVWRDCAVHLRQSQFR